MRKINVIICLLCTLFTGISVAQKSTPKGPQIEFKNLVHDYGTIREGANGRCTFEFKNTGDAPLIISVVQTSCGCLVGEWPKEPIQPGAKGMISLRYDTKRVGPFTKTATVTSNSVDTPVQVISIKGKVEPIPESERPENNSSPEPTNN